MPDCALEEVTKLAAQLSAEDRVLLFNSIIQSFKEPPQGALEETKQTESTTVDGERFVLMSTNATAVIMYRGRLVFKVVFDPDSFRQSRLEMPGWKDAPASPQVKEQIQSTLRSRGMPELEEEELTALVKLSSLGLFEAETDRIAREVSARLPHFTQLLFDAGIKIIELAVRSDFAERTGQRKKTLEETVKILDPYWRLIQAHLNLAPTHASSPGDVPQPGPRPEIRMNGDEGKSFFDVTIGDGWVTGHIDGTEICRLTFNSQNFSDNLHKSLSIPRERLEEELQSILKELRQDNIERSEEERKQLSSAALEKAALMVMVEEKAKHIAERISANLDGLLIALMEDAIKAYTIESSIELNKQTGQTVPVAQYKDMILKTHWSRIRDLAGIKRGGPRKRKGFVWENDNKAAFYKQVEDLPCHSDKSVWEFLLHELIEQAFDAETIKWLRTCPAIQGVPEELFDRAVKAWRKYLPDENWNEMKPEDKPRSFEFRQALHLLGYPGGFAYSTLETYYYEGKKLSDNQT